MDNIGLDALRNQDHQAWTEFMRQLRLLAARACNSTSDDTLLDEVVQESSIALAIKLQSSSFELTSKLSTLMYQIARNQFNKQIRKKGLTTGIDPNELDEVEESKDHLLERESRIQRIEKAYNDLKERCRQILTKYYYEKKRMGQIATEMGYDSAQTARNAKRRCMIILESQVLGKK